MFIKVDIEHTHCLTRKMVRKKSINVSKVPQQFKKEHYLYSDPISECHSVTTAQSFTTPLSLRRAQ